MEACDICSPEMRSSTSFLPLIFRGDRFSEMMRTAHSQASGDADTRPHVPFRAAWRSVIPAPTQMQCRSPCPVRMISGVLRAARVGDTPEHRQPQRLTAPSAASPGCRGRVPSTTTGSARPGHTWGDHLDSHGAADAGRRTLGLEWSVGISMGHSASRGAAQSPGESRKEERGECGGSLKGRRAETQGDGGSRGWGDTSAL